MSCGGGKCKKNCLSLYGFISKGIDKPAKEVQTFLGIEELAAGAYVVTFLCSHDFSFLKVQQQIHHLLRRLEDLPWRKKALFHQVYIILRNHL